MATQDFVQSPLMPLPAWLWGPCRAPKVWVLPPLGPQHFPDLGEELMIPQ